MNVNSTLDALCAAYGEGEGAPTRAQWGRCCDATRTRLSR